MPDGLHPIAAASLFALSQARGPVSFYGAMIALEIVSTLVLYDAAFTAANDMSSPVAVGTAGNDSKTWVAVQ